jgi:hypothetical protein
MRVYKVIPRNDKRGFDSDLRRAAIRWLWYTQISHAICYAKFYSRSQDAVIRVYDKNRDRIVLLKSEGNKWIRHYNTDGNVVDLRWHLRIRGACLIHINNYRWCRIILERSKANPQHSCSRH